MLSRPKFTLITIVAFLMPWIMVSCSGSGGGVDNDEPEDTTPPSSISDLHVTVVTTNSIALQWTSPGNDGNAGCASEYDLRAAYDSITVQTFSAAHHIDSIVAPLPAGMEQSTVIDSLQPDTKYYFAIKTRDWEGNWSAISNVTSARCHGDTTVEFPDTALNRIIREIIGKPTGDIRKSDLTAVSRIEAADGNIADLTGIEHCPVMAYLFLQRNHITSLDPIAGLIMMVEVNFGGNNISDVTPLSGLTSLVQLELVQNPITDIGSLSGLSNLRVVRLRETQVTDYSSLFGLPSLQELDIATNNLGDIAFVQNFSHLKVLSLASNNITSIAPLSGLTTLENLGLTFNQISDLSALTGLVNLKELSLQYNWFSDIQPLVNNTGLGAGDIIYISHNSLSQYSVDSLIPKLEARGVTVYH
ncbi:MAG: leucine-rich repeat domain-containing protein [Candidatus Zixiibacteriota bacterium]